MGCGRIQGKGCRAGGGGFSPFLLGVGGLAPFCTRQRRLLGIASGTSQEALKGIVSRTFLHASAAPAGSRVWYRKVAMLAQREGSVLEAKPPVAVLATTS
jgi:hypothetical protein